VSFKVVAVYQSDDLACDSNTIDANTLNGDTLSVIEHKQGLQIFATRYKGTKLGVIEMFVSY